MVQVPFDFQGKVYTLKPEMAKGVAFFDEYPGLIEATCFKVNDSLVTLDIRFKPENEVYRVNLEITNSEFAKIKRSLALNINSQAKIDGLDQEGRTSFLIGNSLMSIYYGISTPLAFELNEPKLALGLGMVVGGAGIIIPWRNTRDKEFTKGMASLTLYGQSRGILQGFLLGSIVGDNFDSRSQVLMSVGLSIGEGFLCHQWAKKTNMSYGRASTIGAMGDFGILAGSTGASGLGLFEERGNDNLEISLILGSIGGTLIGSALANNQNYKVGDAMMLRATGLLGAYLPLAITQTIDGASVRQISGATALGTLGGVVIGHKIAQNYDFSSSDGVKICLGTIASGLIGGGVGYIVSPENDSNSDNYMWLGSAAGATIGYLFFLNQYRGNSLIQNNGYSLHFNLNPIPLLNPEPFNPEYPMGQQGQAVSMIWRF